MNHLHFLVPISHSGGAEPAFERALALARPSGAKLHLLHAVPADQPLSLWAAERLARWADLRERAAAAGVTVQTAEQHGDPADVIVLHANSRAVDLVVMSSGRRTGWDRFRQPSIAERVIRRTTRPTLVIGQDDSVPTSFRNVLVAVGLSGASRSVIEMATHVARHDARELTLLHAVNTIEAADAVLSLGRWLVPEYRDYVLDAARQQLEAVVPEIDADINVQVRVAPGPAADAIAAHAAAVDADLIVVGRTRRFMGLGATGAHLLRHTDRALLVVPPPAAAGRAIKAEASSLRRAA